MVAYSFKRRFVAPIQVGLNGDAPLTRLGDDGKLETVRPKRQTIRADRKRHARPGEEVQLYCGMRTKHCFLIGRARCVSVEPIQLYISLDYIADYATGCGVTDGFARGDGFGDAAEMAQFWLDEHGPGNFAGVLIKWEPL